MRKLRTDAKDPSHGQGPYLLFARSHPAFSDHHDFEDWSFLGQSLDGKLWGRNAVVAAFNTPDELIKAGDIPDWVEFIELASVSHEFGNVPFALPATELEEDTYQTIWHPSSKNLTSVFRPRGASEKVTFDRRLLIVTYADDDTEHFISRHNTKIRTGLGGDAVGVWHSEDIFGFAFHDARGPQAIINSLSRWLNEDDVIDAAVFRVASVMTERGTISPLDHFLRLAPSRRTGAR